MKGTFIHVTEVWEHANRFNEVQTTSKLEKTVDWVDPGRELWNLMTEDMFKVYSKDGHVEIALEDFRGYYPDSLAGKIKDVKSWAGFRYSDYDPNDEDCSGEHAAVWHWYLFV